MRRAGLVVAAMITLAGVGCAMPIEDEPNTEVGEQSEALNLAPNFKIGIQSWLYDTRGSFPETPPMSEVALGAGIGGSAWTVLPNNLANPNGLRISLANLKSGISLETIDFRIGALAADRGEKDGSPDWTPWASDGGGWSQYGGTDGGDRIDADFFAIVMQVRPWPTDNDQRLTDFQIGIQACESTVHNGGFHYCDAQEGKTLYTAPISKIAQGTSWATSVATNQFGYSIDGFKLDLKTTLF